MTFPSFETVIRRSGEDVRWLIGDQKRGVAGIKGDQQAECRRVTSPSACNYAGKIQGQGRQKNTETVRRVKSYQLSQFLIRTAGSWSISVIAGRM